MKKSITLLLIVLAAFSCKIPTATNGKLDNKTEVALKGNWAIASVTYPGSDYIKVTSFDLADSKCLVNSNWKFVSNNNKGTMALNSAACTAFSSPITWFINKEGEFVMKILDNQKAKKVTSGYVLKVANVTESSFQLIDKIDVGGKNVEVVYNFSRV
jgi:curli biogenesis system outer membrane secretion channel CsgG